MPPKKQENKPKKVAVDKTFGMKNKNKSTKVQQQVKIIQQQEAQKGVNKEVLAKKQEKDRIAEKKKQELAKRELEGSLYGGTELIVQPKVPFGVDPKTILCVFHKVGKCTKGSKCKFSHDLNADRKGAKASMYADQRDEKKQAAPAEGSTMADWTEEQLREVLSKKGNPKATTDIVCKHFLEAIEDQKYGYFWQCPNGENCMYRHALPPGFVLKSQRKKDDDDAKNREISLEEFLEVERHKLDHSKLTPLTKETFAEWKKTRVSKKEAEESALQSAKSATAAAGKLSGLSGRDLFTFNPEMLGAESDDEYSDGGDDGGADDEWDLEAMRVKTEREREERELERIRQLDAAYGKLSTSDPVEPPAA